MRQRPFRVRLVGVRTSWRTLDDGDFFCPDCGGDRRYRRRAGRRRFVLLGLPLIPRGPAGPVVECVACRGHFAVDSLDRPTTGRLATMLREAVHSVALVVLTAGGADARAVRESAVQTLRAAGFGTCDEEELTALVAVPHGDGSGRAGPSRSVRHTDPYEALIALTPHLAVPGRESLLLQGARIALADAPYCAAEREALGAIGQALQLGTEDVDRLLIRAGTPS